MPEARLSDEELWALKALVYALEDSGLEDASAVEVATAAKIHRFEIDAWLAGYRERNA